ncbi:ROK family protein [Shewanella glacialimarina]|uniref:ROK family protein n=1 Tax=Shewanella glacialimarina TaxID=2590884 RepID=UPI001CF8D087|nr:ROK family protein [Shewanella glacialimarina]UCX05727.1 ROK family protein [Shewanella glacialimarina]
MIIAIDVGGTKISAALIFSDKVTETHIVEQRTIASVIHTDLTHLSQHLVELCQGWIERATQVAIACTGQVGDEFVNFLSAKQKLPLKAQLESAFELPVTIINDAAAAAWAEYCVMKTIAIDSSLKDNNVIGSEVISGGDNTLVYITVSTGIGGGIIQNGKLLTCVDGFCAHLGHVSVLHGSQKTIQCHCGRVNCAESIASGTAIAKQASIILNQEVSCKAVFEQYFAVPEIALLINNATSAVCDLIANVKAMTGTNIIILGGSVGSVTLFHQQVVAKTANLPSIYQVSIKPPQMGANADLMGAAFYVRKNQCPI